MDEVELRLAALELLAIEAVALIPPPMLQQLVARVRAGLSTLDRDEAAIRHQALAIIDDGAGGFDEFDGGFQIPMPEDD